MVRLLRYSAGQHEPFLAWMNGDPVALAFIAKSFPRLVELDAPRLFECFVDLRDDHLAWAIEDDRRRLLGHLELKPTPKVRDSERELVYIVRRESRGVGVATEAVRLALLSPTLDSVSAIVAFVNPQNVASRRVLEKAGFRVSAGTDNEYRYSFDR